MIAGGDSRRGAAAAEEAASGAAPPTAKRRRAGGVWRPKAVIFDVDGTLIDTEQATCDYIAQLLAPHGLRWTLELHRRIVGTIKFFPRRCLEVLGVDPARIEELCKVLPPRVTSPEYIAFVVQRLTIKPGASALIRRLESCRVPLGLCTSRRLEDVSAIEGERRDVAELLRPLRARVVGSVDPRTGEQLPSKPDPAVYVAAAELVGARPEECLVVEDSPTGINSAKAAGCFVVAVPEHFIVGDPDAERVLRAADLRLASLEELQSGPRFEEFFGSSPPLLLGCGNATVDVTCEVSREELAEFGLAPGTEASGFSDDLKARIVDFAGRRPGATKRSGGAALNAIRVAAWSAGDRLRAAFVGAVGRDEHACILREAMREVGVVPLLQEVTDQSTGVCAALVERETRDRALSTVRAAAGALDTAFLEEPGVAALVNEAALLYATSFALTSEPRIGAVLSLADKVLSFGGALAVNLSSVGILGKVQGPLLKLLPRATYAFGNVAELRAFAGLQGWEQMDDRTAAARLAELLDAGGRAGLVPAAVITAGAGPTIVALRGGATSTHEVPPVPAGEVQDTTGAGDAFVGGFLATLVVDRAPLADCVENGHRCAAFVLRRRGCDLS